MKNFQADLGDKTFNCKYLRELSQIFEMACTVYSGARGNLINEKNLK
jgi:hypothetical protein